MKTIFYSVLLLLSLFAFPANAQIKDTILNVRLGHSTRQNVSKMVQSEGYSYSLTPETITCHDVDFAGYVWEKVVFFFYKSILYKIRFDDPCVKSEKSLVSWKRPTKSWDILEAIREAAKSKYHQYQKGTGAFQDGVTKLNIYGEIEYENIPLAEKLSTGSLNDL